MTSTQVPIDTGTAQVRKQDTRHRPYVTATLPEKRIANEYNTEPQGFSQDGKCTCCPYGFHIDLGFLNFCNDIEAGSTLRNLKRIQQTKRNLRKSMEIMMTDPNSDPLAFASSKEAEQLLHMISYEQSATHDILRHIDSSVAASHEDVGRWNDHKGSHNGTPDHISYMVDYPEEEPSYQILPVPGLIHTDSMSSLSAESTVSSDALLLHQAELVLQQQHHSISGRTTTTTTTQVIENPVLEMATAEMIHYSTTSSAQLVEDEYHHHEDVPPRTRERISHVIPPTSTATHISRLSLEDNKTSVQSMRESTDVSLQRIKVLEEQVKAIPILQVRISVLKEEKRLLNLQLKASQTSMKPVTRSTGVGDNIIYSTENEEHHIMRSPRIFQIPTTGTITLEKFQEVKSLPATSPKHARTSSTAVGDHSVLEPYNLQPDLPSGYTIQENETVFEIYSKILTDTRNLTTNRHQVEQSLDRSYQHTQGYEHSNRNFRTSTNLQIKPENKQLNQQVDQIQKNFNKMLTRTIGIGEGNVFDDHTLHVQEKELRTVILGQSNAPAKRNVGIECRPSTRDVGVSFKCEEEKPETRTVGINVNYDTTGIYTSLDFKGETQLRKALQGVLQRSVRSVGTNCILKQTCVENGTMTDVNGGVDAGCGDEDHSVDVEVRRVVARKSVAVTAKSDVGNKCVGTEPGWTLEAGTNTCQVELWHKAVMTERQKQNSVPTNTETTHTFSASNQTDQKVFLSTDQVKHTANNTENVIRFSTGISTDNVITKNAYVNTIENVNDLFQESESNKIATNSKKIEPLQYKNEVKERMEYSNIIGDANILNTFKEEQADDASTFSDAVTQEQIIHNISEHERSFLNKSEYTKKSSKFDYGNQHFSSLEISSRSSPLRQNYFSSHENQTYRHEDLHEKVPALGIDKTPSPDQEFSETVVEHFLLTKDGKKLISEETITTTAAGTNRSFKEYTDGTRQVGDRNSQNSYREKSSVYGGIDDNSWSSTTTSSSSVHDKTDTERRRIEDESCTTFANNQYVLDASLNQASPLVEPHTADISSRDYHSAMKINNDAYWDSRQQVSRNNRMSAEEVTYAIRRAGSVEDFMPNDIRMYMSIDPSTSLDTSLSKDMVYTFSDQSSGTSSSRSTTAENKPNSAETNPFKMLKTNVTKKSNNEALQASVTTTMNKNEALQASGTTTMNKNEALQASGTTTMNKNEIEQRNTEKKETSETKENAVMLNLNKSAFSSSSTASTYCSTVLEDGSCSKTSSFRDNDGAVTANLTNSERLLSDSNVVTILEAGSNSEVSSVKTRNGSEVSSVKTRDGSEVSSVKTRDGSEVSSVKTRNGSEVSSVKTRDGSEVSSVKTRDGIRSTNMRSLELKSIMKHKKETQSATSRKIIIFAETVTGGTGSSSENDNSSDTDSTESLDDIPLNDTELDVASYCQTKETVTGGLHEGQIVTQNIREIYELSDDVRNACVLLDTFLTDSSAIPANQLNSSLDIIQQEWFQISSYKLTCVHTVEDFLSSVHDISKRLLKYIIGMTDTNGNTAIHYCISHCNFEIAGLLLDTEVCDVNKRNKAGYTPIMLTGLATFQNQQQRDIVKRLLSFGEIDAKATTTQQTALMLAASHGRIEMVQLLTEEGADVNLQDVDGSTALMCACEHGHLEIVNHLLTVPSIDVNITDNEGSTALNIAMETSHKDIGVVLYKYLNFSKPPSPGSQQKRRISSSPTQSNFGIP